MTLRLSVLCLAALLAAAPARAGQATPTRDADIATGRALFLQHCAGCHGPAGSGGRGADLAKPQLEHVDTDPELYRLIRTGIPGTEMPGSFQLTDDQIVKVAAFVRSLGRVAPEPIPGDSARGRQVFQTRCVTCHYAEGAGGITGPSMTGIGSRRSASWMRTKVLDASQNIPDDFRLVELTTKTGQKLTGLRVNEDTWSIQVRDLSGKTHSYWKRDLTSFTKRSATLMPSYKNVLSDAQLDDLVAYLASLKEKRP